MRYEIVEGNFPVLTIYLKYHEKCFAEMSGKHKSYIGSSPVYSEEDDREKKTTGKLSKKFATGAELDGTAATFTGPSWSKVFQRHARNVEHKKDLEAGGEKNFVLYESLDEDEEHEQEVSFTTCFPGAIMPWYEEGYGKLRVDKGAFLAAWDMKVGSFTVKNYGVINHSGTQGKFLELSGSGTAFLEVPGIVIKKFLAKGEAYDVTPGHLLGFTEGISLEMKDSGDLSLRIAETTPFGIRCTAETDDGIIYMCSGNPPAFWDRQPKK